MNLLSNQSTSCSKKSVTKSNYWLIYIMVNKDTEPLWISADGSILLQTYTVHKNTVLLWISADGSILLQTYIRYIRTPYCYEYQPMVWLCCKTSLQFFICHPCAATMLIFSFFYCFSKSANAKIIFSLLFVILAQQPC